MTSKKNITSFNHISSSHTNENNHLVHLNSSFLKRKPTEGEIDNFIELLKNFSSGNQATVDSSHNLHLETATPTLLKNQAISTSSSDTNCRVTFDNDGTLMKTIHNHSPESYLQEAERFEHSTGRGFERVSNTSSSGHIHNLRETTSFDKHSDLRATFSKDEEKYFYSNRDSIKRNNMAYKQGYDKMIPPNETGGYSMPSSRESLIRNSTSMDFRERYSYGSGSSSSHSRYPPSTTYHPRDMDFYQTPTMTPTMNSQRAEFPGDSFLSDRQRERSTSFSHSIEEHSKRYREKSQDLSRTYQPPATRSQRSISPPSSKSSRRVYDSVLSDKDSFSNYDMREESPHLRRRLSSPAIPSPPPPPILGDFKNRLKTSYDHSVDKSMKKETKETINPISTLLADGNVSISALLEAAMGISGGKMRRNEELMDETGSSFTSFHSSKKMEILSRCEEKICQLYSHRIAGPGSFLPDPIPTVVPTYKFKSPLIDKHPRLQFNSRPISKVWHKSEVTVPDVSSYNNIEDDVDLDSFSSNEKRKSQSSRKEYKENRDKQTDSRKSGYGHRDSTIPRFQFNDGSDVICLTDDEIEDDSDSDGKRKSRSPRNKNKANRDGNNRSRSGDDTLCQASRIETRISFNNDGQVKPKIPHVSSVPSNFNRQSYVSNIQLVGPPVSQSNASNIELVSPPGVTMADFNNSVQPWGTYNSLNPKSQNSVESSYRRAPLPTPSSNVPATFNQENWLEASGGYQQQSPFDNQSLIQYPIGQQTARIEAPLPNFGKTPQDYSTPTGTLQNPMNAIDRCSRWMPLVPPPTQLPSKQMETVQYPLKQRSSVSGSKTKFQPSKNNSNLISLTQNPCVKVPKNQAETSDRINLREPSKVSANMTSPVRVHQVDESSKKSSLISHAGRSRMKESSASRKDSNKKNSPCSEEIFPREKFKNDTKDQISFDVEESALEKLSKISLEIRNIQMKDNKVVDIIKDLEVGPKSYSYAYVVKNRILLKKDQNVFKIYVSEMIVVPILSLLHMTFHNVSENELVEMAKKILTFINTLQKEVTYTYHSCALCRFISDKPADILSNPSNITKPTVQPSSQISPPGENRKRFGSPNSKRENRSPSKRSKVRSSPRKLSPPSSGYRSRRSHSREKSSDPSNKRRSPSPHRYGMRRHRDDYRSRSRRERSPGRPKKRRLPSLERMGRGRDVRSPRRKSPRTERSDNRRSRRCSTEVRIIEPDKPKEADTIDLTIGIDEPEEFNKTSIESKTEDSISIKSQNIEIKLEKGISIKKIDQNVKKNYEVREKEKNKELKEKTIVEKPKERNAINDTRIENVEGDTATTRIENVEGDTATTRIENVEGDTATLRECSDEKEAGYKNKGENLVQEGSEVQQHNSQNIDTKKSEMKIQISEASVDKKEEISEDVKVKDDTKISINKEGMKDNESTGGQNVDSVQDESASWKREGEAQEENNEEIVKQEGERLEEISAQKEEENSKQSATKREEDSQKLDEYNSANSNENKLTKLRSSDEQKVSDENDRNQNEELTKKENNLQPKKVCLEQESKSFIKLDFKTRVRMIQMDIEEMKCLIERLESKNNNRPNVDASYVLKAGMLCKKCRIAGNNEVRIYAVKQNLERMVHAVHTMSSVHASQQKTLMLFNKHFVPIDDIDKVVSTIFEDCKECEK